MKFKGKVTQEWEKLVNEIKNSQKEVILQLKEKTEDNRLEIHFEDETITISGGMGRRAVIKLEKEVMFKMAGIEEERVRITIRKHGFTNPLYKTDEYTVVPKMEMLQSFLTYAAFEVARKPGY